MEKKSRKAASPSAADQNVEASPRFHFQLDEMMTVAEAARLRGVTRSAIWDLIRRRRLRVEMVYGRAFVYRAEVENFEPLIAAPGK